MRTLTDARIVGTDASSVDIALDRGFRLTLFFLDAHLARALVTPTGGLRTPRTWSLSPELSGDDPIEGRARLDLTGFPFCPIQVIEETDASITIETALLRVEVRRSPLALSWSFRANEHAAFEHVFRDRQTQAYLYNRSSKGFAHFLERDPPDHYYGFGEKSGNANKHGRRLRMRATDALGYDAETSDPLYKHIPFNLTVRPDRKGSAFGLFYDNLAHGAFNLGQEIDAYHGPYRSFQASDGDLDLYAIFGPQVSDVVARYTALTGRTAFPPRWSLSYSGSTMQYTDAPNAEQRLLDFLDLLKTHGIPCQSFHLSSGYTKRGDNRYVFTWDRERFPDPARLVERFLAAGVRLIANVKPALLIDHPRFQDVESLQGFVRDGEDETSPHLAQFWGGEAAYLDFTNPTTSAWWTAEVQSQLLQNGVASTWNDNNEFEIWDDEAKVYSAAPETSDGKRQSEGAPGSRIPATSTIACLRPVQTGLMLRASMIAQRDFAPTKRPFLVSRSGGPGMQRYAQTWTGDNRTDWKTLKYNLRMAHGLSLSGIFNFGHDVGGFAGPKPDAELFMRWIEQGIYWPRFTIHSWNDDGSANEPWMHPEILPMVRAAMEWRERLVPLLYTLLWRAHCYHEPILRPLFYDFPSEAKSYNESDIFMLGADLLIAPVVEPGAESRRVWLPETPGGWYDIRTGNRFISGEHEVTAPLGAAPTFMRAGSILPLGPCPSWDSGPLTLRLFPLSGGASHVEIYNDDGESIADRADPPCLLHITALWGNDHPQLTFSRRGALVPRWSRIRFEDAAGRCAAVSVNGARASKSFNPDQG